MVSQSDFPINEAPEAQAADPLRRRIQRRHLVARPHVARPLQRHEGVQEQNAALRDARRIRPCWSASAYINTSIVKQEERYSETADMASNVRENALEWVHVVRALRQEIVGGADRHY